jgi:glycosyltransferase involved in cell wall biosynthesis
MKKTRPIVFVSHDASRTGAPIFLLRFIRWFKENESVPFRVLIGSDGPLVKDFASFAPVDLFQPPRTFRNRVLRKLHVDSGVIRHHRAALRTKYEKEGVGLVYANTFVTGKVLDFLSFLSCPTLCHVHELSSEIRPGSENAELMRKHVSRYIAVSDAVRDYLTTSVSIRPDRVQTVHGFIPLDNDLFPQRAHLRRAIRVQLGIESEAKVILGCGSIGHRKGVDLFVEVATRALRACPHLPVHFVWVGGDRAQAREAQQLAAHKGIGRAVHFIGSLPEVAPLYAASDVFLLTSREDPFPLVMMEAALHSVPVICFADSGGAGEFVGRDAGIIVPKQDVDAMARATLSLLTDEELGERIGLAARRKVLRRYALNDAAPRLSAIIREELAYMSSE